MILTYKRYYLRLIFLTSYMVIRTEGRSCVYDDYRPDQILEPCGQCGVCRDASSKGNSGGGVCDYKYLVKSGLFTDSRGAQCELRNNCDSEKEAVCKGSERSYALCHPLFGTYKCQCKGRFYGRTCENKIDSKFTWRAENRFHMADVKNVVFTPVFYYMKFATLYISLMRTGKYLKIYVDNGRENLVYNEKKCKKEFEKLNEFCLGLFSNTNNIRLCRGITHQEEIQFRKTGCLLRINILYPSNYDKNRVIYKHTNPSINKEVMANLETVTVAVYNNLGSFINKPVFSYSFDMINIHQITGKKRTCSLRVKLVNCGETMASRPKISAYSDIAILWSLKILPFDSSTTCLNFGKVETAWKVWRLEENHDELSDETALEMYQRDIYLVRRDPLRFGIYKVKLSLTVTFTDYVLRENAYCYLEVVRSPVQVTLRGGSLRKVYYKKPLTFKILLSYTPDRYEPDNNMKTVFNWQCDHLKDKICKPLETSDTGRRLTGPFPDSASYEFTLDTKTVDELGLEEKQHQEKQVVVFVPTPILCLAIKCLKNCGGSTFKSNPQEIIHLKVLLEERIPDSEHLKYDWKYKCLDNALDGLRGVEEIQMEGNVDETVLIIDYNKLNASSRYLFVVSLENSQGYAEIIVETDKPLSGISCKVNPATGFRSETYFSVRCQIHNETDTFPSLTYEFYNRNDNEVVGRMLGYSITGDLDRFVITRDKLIVCVTNFFGTSSEIEISVELKNPPPPSVKKQERDVFVGNYIDRLALLSSQSDSAPTRLFWVDTTTDLLGSLAKEPVSELMGAILLQNTLHQVACEKLVVSVQKKFKCSTILNVASTMYHAMKTMTDSLSSGNANPRFMNTRRTKSFVNSVLQCSSVVLQLNSLNKYKSGDIDVHDCLKTSTLYTIDTLSTLEHVIALQIFPSIKQWYESRRVHMFVQDVSPGYVDDFDRKTSTFKDLLNFVDPLERIQYYTQIIIFEINPFWWGSGNKINTNVFSMKLFKENKPVPDAETKKRLDYILSFKAFHPKSVSGFVAQPDPVKGPKVTDFEITIYRVFPEVHSKTFVKFSNIGVNKTLRVLILKNVRPDFDLMNAKAVDVTHESNELTFDSDNVEDDSFYYIGILPGLEVEVGGTVDYTFHLFSARCVVWKQKAWMSGNKCVVNRNLDVEAEILICSCTLLSLIIAGYLYTPTNCLNPFSNFSLFLETPDNPYVVSVLLVVFLVFSILLIWTSIKDRDDEKKSSAYPLEENGADGSHVYLIGVFTGSRIGAGTTSNVGFQIFGEKGTSGVHALSSSTRSILQSGGDDWFLLHTSKDLGRLLQIQLWTDFTGFWPNWYCKLVFVCDISNYVTSEFIVEKWFGVNIKEVCLEKLVKTSSTNEINSFDTILSDNLVYGFRDLHFFFSLFHKHPRSVVPRTERLTVVLSTVLLSACLSISLLSISTPVLEDIPGYSVSSNIFFYGFLCSAIASAFGSINMTYFRRCYSLTENTDHSHDACDRQSVLLTYNSKLEPKDKFEKSSLKTNFLLKLYKKCVRKYINTCYLIPVKSCKSLIVVNCNKSKNNLAWMITSIVIVVSTYTIIVSSLTFGEVKTLIWMTCLLVSLTTTVFVFLPIKVILISFIFSLEKVRIFDLFSHRIRTENLFFNLGKKEMDFKQNNENSNKLLLYNYTSKKEQQNKRVLKAHYRTIRIWITAFIFESFILLILLYLIMDEFETSKYFQSSSTVCNEILYKVICDDIYYADTSFYNLKNDVLKSVLPKLFKTKWYNGEELSPKGILFEDTGWLNDITSRLIGDPKLFQIRVQKNLCKIPNVMSTYTRNCFPVLSRSTVDRKNYCLGWTDDDWTAVLFHESPWRFSTGVGVGVRTSSDYHVTEGSYVVSLLNTLELAQHVTKNLIDTSWIDSQTRVIVLQFLTYNPNNNIFTSSYFVTEIFPTRFLKTTHTVKSIGFYYHKLSFLGVIFILFSVFFLIRLVITINIIGVRTFFKDLWNCYDVFIFIVYSSTVINYAQLMFSLGREQEVVEASVTDKNIHLETVFLSLGETVWALCYTFVSVSIRFVRITRINLRCRQYLTDLVETKTQLFWTLLISFVSLYRQFRLIMFFIEPPSVYDVIDILGFTTKYHPLEKEYYSTNGRIVALILFQLSEISLFSFTISLLHHHRQVKLRRMSSLVEKSL